MYKMRDTKNMLKHYDYDLIVIGTGSGGATAASEAARMGKRVAVVEKGKIGGDCPNYACVPTKSLLHVAETFDMVKSANAYGISMAWPKVDLKKVHTWVNRVRSHTAAAKTAELFDDEGIDVIDGEARFVSSHEIRVGKRHYSASNFLIATGASISIPPIYGLERTGFITYLEAGDMDKAPKSVAIIGGGLVGVEYAFIYSSLGIKVDLIEGCDRIIMAEDAEATELIQEIMEARGIKLHLSVTVHDVLKRDGKKVVTLKKGEKSFTISAHEVLVATGMAPNTDLDLEKAGVGYDKKGIIVNDYLQTSQPHIFGAGDVVGPFKLSATGMLQSLMAVRNMFAGKKTKVDYDIVPRCLFVDPEFSAVGVTEEKLKEHKVKYKKGVTSLTKVARANSDNVQQGFVKVLTMSDGTIVGASIVSPRAGEMIHELALAMKLGAKASDIAQMIHVYPSYSEAVKIACSEIK